MLTRAFLLGLSRSGEHHSGVIGPGSSLRAPVVAPECKIVFRSLQREYVYIYILIYINIYIYSLHSTLKGISHFVPWRRLHDDGGGFRKGFFMGCSSNTVGGWRVKKKPLLLDYIAV